ncbi:hypothetical protein DW980_09645 [Bacteroides stercoris]|nr:hypothetical protein DW980_09645 [Bacteroides stercoris]
MGRSGYFSLNLSANSVMRGRLDARRTLKSLVADLRIKSLAKGRQSSRYIENLRYKRFTGKESADFLPSRETFSSRSAFSTSRA